MSQVSSAHALSPVGLYPLGNPTRCHHGHVCECAPEAAESGLLGMIGGRVFVTQLVTDFYQAIGQFMVTEDIADHQKQQSRQAQFLCHVLAEQAEPVYSSRAHFLAQGLSPALFAALLEYFEGHLVELGYPTTFSAQLARTAGDLYTRSGAQRAVAV
ncbi:globin family protein [Microbulbifer agarilyticus]|uniref:hypothetical protein n=1 Tax=Microbulbifer agarilyticus TaxID=260552 RepID=UPI001CD2F954|nr:hypothetical protein [Microbulbifer agarilyticus]MCA0901308.1 hypothetical protein [Microbulbifer agarilyticus]